MTKKEKCDWAIYRGLIYNSETGILTSRLNNELSSKTDKGYIGIKLCKDGKRYSLSGHIFAWYYHYNELVDELDHIDGDRTNNKINNLRPVTRTQNQWNQTKAKGYSWNKENKNWRVQIQANKKKIYIGSYNNEDDARQAYLDAKKLYHKF